MAGIAQECKEMQFSTDPLWVEARLRAAISDIEYVDVEKVSSESTIDCEDGCGLALKLTVISPAFDGLKLLARHRLVNDALKPELMSGAIHSLPQLQTLTPAQWQAQSTKNRLSWVDGRLRDAIPYIEHLEVQDVSDGHTAKGFTDGSKRSLNPHGLELKITVVSSSFDNMKLLERQRLVSSALHAELGTGAIHSLPHLKTLTPMQWQAKTALVSEAKL